MISTFCSPIDDDSSSLEPSQLALKNALERSVIIHYHISDTAKGTGILLDKEGHILTAYHVIFGWEDRVKVSQDSKTFIPAKVVKIEPKLDLAILKANLTNNITNIEWIDRSDLKINEPIFLFGAAWGLQNSFLKGYISHLNRTGFDFRMPSIPFIQTIGTSFPGCSGAAVYTFNGKALGLNRATIGNEPGNSIGLVIPSGYIKAFLKANKINTEK
jgi:S1-C subfamily serine protease